MRQRGRLGRRSIDVLILGLAAVACASPSPNPEDGAAAANPHLVVYDGGEGPGAGKHIVFLAGDHEYRSEEILPAMARILARRYGFTASVFFTLDDEGFIEPGSSNIAGLGALDSADLLVIAIRFQDFPKEEMQHIVDYLNRGGPVFGIRTATHAFRIDSGPFARYSWDYGADDFRDGFGEQILGETWVGHYGTNHEQSSRILPVETQVDHPILRGVRDMHVQSGGYQAYPVEGSEVIAVGQVLNGMDSTAAPDPDKELLPVAWTRTYAGTDGSRGRVFTSTHGASEDLLNEGFRRMFINAALWNVGLEGAIRPDNDVSFVGPYHPVVFSFDGYRRGVRPADLAGWDTPIMAPDRPTAEDSTGIEGERR